MTSFEIPILHTARLTLRAFRESDLDALAAMHQDPEVMRHLGAGQLRSRGETWDGMARALGQWALRGTGLFALEHTQTGQFVGRAGILHPETWPEPELAYSLARPFWGQGLATEAATAVRDRAFTASRLPHLASFILPENTASQAVAARLGAFRTADIEIIGLTVQRWEYRRAPTHEVAQRG